MVTLFVQNNIQKARTTQKNALKADISMKAISFNESANRSALPPPPPPHASGHVTPNSVCL